MVILEVAALAKAFDVIFQKYRKDKEDNPQTQLVKFSPVNFSHTELDDAVTTQKDFIKDKPNMEFTNPYKKSCLVKSISIVPDDLFKTNGMIEVYIGDEIFFRNKKFGNFKKIEQSVITIDGGEVIKPNESVKVYLKTSDDAVAVGITAQVTFGA